jgi:D-amino-acid oxidase
MRVCVLGSGVVGLSVAHRLAERGHHVRVLGDADPLATTSAVAAALWYPYLASPAARTGAWGARTYEVLSDLARQAPESGVDRRPGRELAAAGTPVPPWHAHVDDFGLLDPDPDGRGGWSFTSPVVDMSLYLPWLAAQVRSLGVHLETVPRLGPSDLAAAAAGDDALVLCPGLGAVDLLADTDVVPVRGQVVLLEQVGLESWLLAEGDGDPTYVVPRRRTIVCGGTARTGDWSTEPDATTARDILTRCRALLPQLAEAAVVGHRVGLRPVRPQVRLELERSNDALGVPVVYCYGHGGAGVTLSWGCAEDVADLVGSLG